MVRTPKPIVPAVLALTFALATALVVPSRALADEISDLTAEQQETNDQIVSQQAKASELADESEQLQAQLDGLYPQLQDTAQRLDDAQSRVSSLLSYQYKNGSDTNFLSVVLSSTSWDDFVTRITYSSSVTDSLTQAVEQVREEQDALDSQKTELESLIQQKKQNEEDVASTVAGLQAKSAQIDSRLQQIAEQAAAEQAAQQAAAQQAAAQQQGSSSGGTSSSVPDGSWGSGLASSYNPEHDGTATATGIPLDWSSYTVAIPMRWSSFWSYYYRSVEISYGGTTIVAMVTDCGVLPGGRVLDLSPACAEALCGSSESSDWGVRTVSYRFL